MTALVKLDRIGGRTAFRVAKPPVSGMLRPRLLLVNAVLTVLVLLVFCYGMTIGDYPLSLGEVVSAVFGTGDGGALFVVRELRLPRALVGLLAGAAFGMSGAIFQTMTRNALASPDMIGINAGAATAVVGGIVLGVGAGLSTQALGLAGGLVGALVIYLLAWNRGTTGYRIILVGIGVSSIYISATDYLLTKAEIYQAQEAMGWLIGSLNNRGWEQARPLALGLAVLAPASLLLSRWMRILQLGDETAKGLGIPVQRARLVLMLAGVLLVALATAAAGPVLFVSLVAPQIAQRLVGLAWPPLTASALTGSLVLLGSDLIGRNIMPDTQLPVGVVTGVLGAPILLWLLGRANRSGQGG